MYVCADKTNNVTIPPTHAHTFPKQIHSLHPLFSYFLPKRSQNAPTPQLSRERIQNWCFVIILKVKTRKIHSQYRPPLETGTTSSGSHPIHASEEGFLLGEGVL